MRVAYAVAPKEIVAKMTVGKQAEDVHTPMLNQMIVNEWLTNYDINAHIGKIRKIYSDKLNLMCDLLDEKLPDFFNYVKPEGGLFVWCALPKNVDMLTFVQKAIENNVAVVPGTAFLTDETMPTQYIRLNFSTPSNEKIIFGVEALKKTALNI